MAVCLSASSAWALLREFLALSAATHVSLQNRLYSAVVCGVLLLQRRTQASFFDRFLISSVTQSASCLLRALGSLLHAVVMVSLKEDQMNSTPDSAEAVW